MLQRFILIQFAFTALKNNFYAFSLLRKTTNTAAKARPLMITRASIRATSVPSAVLGTVFWSELPLSLLDSQEFSELDVPLLSEPVFDESDGVLSEDAPPLSSPVAGITTGAVISFSAASSEKILSHFSQVQ